MTRRGLFSLFGTRRSLFARMLGALAAMPLVGKAVAKPKPAGIKIHGMSLNEYHDLSGIHPAMLGLDDPRNEPQIRKLLGDPVVSEWNEAVDRQAKRIQDGMDRWFHEG